MTKRSIEQVMTYILIPSCTYGNHVWDKRNNANSRSCVRCGATIKFSMEAIK